MSGNKLLKSNQILFKAGDQSDGMYIIRRGELKVYLEQNGKEMSLASVGPGGIIGEMALFDNKPRSASVKATSETEVSHVSPDDFTKLMKQIPKWFVTLMSALSTRLRQTNERVQKLEGLGPPKGRPYQTVTRFIHIISLLWHKNGEKEDKEWTLDYDLANSTLVEMFHEDPEKVKSFLEVIKKHKLVSIKQNSYKKQVIASLNRGTLDRFNTFLSEFIQARKEGDLFISDGALSIVDWVVQLSKNSAYETLSYSLEEIIAEASKNNVNTDNFSKDIMILKNSGTIVIVINTGNNSYGIKTSKKDLPTFVSFHKVIQDLYKANLV